MTTENLNYHLGKSLSKREIMRMTNSIIKRKSREEGRRRKKKEDKNPMKNTKKKTINKKMATNLMFGTIFSPKINLNQNQ